MSTESSLLTLWSDSTAFSASIWFVIAIVSLYLARSHAHELIDRLCTALAGVLRLGAGLLLTYARRNAARHRAFLRIAAEENAARRLERQFRRIGTQVDRDLGDYPRLHRILSEQVERISTDYRQAADTPPAPPSWLSAVQTIATANAGDDPAVSKILRDMHGTLDASCHHALLEYRAANRQRYRALGRMQPFFRRIATTLDTLQNRLDSIAVHARAIDRQMASYEGLRARREQSIRIITFDAPIRIIGGTALLAIASLAALLSHRLVGEPLNTMLSGVAADTALASSTLILIELGLGIWIADCLGVTRLLGATAHFDEQVRRRLAVLGGVLLSLFALLQGALAWSSHISAPVIAEPAWLAPATAALLGVSLPFVIALAAVPLEAVIQSGRSLLCGSLAAAAHIAAVVMRLAAAVVGAVPATLKKLYDLCIFLPLWGEQAVRAVRERASATAD